MATAWKIFPIRRKMRNCDRYVATVCKNFICVTEIPESTKSPLINQKCTRYPLKSIRVHRVHQKSARSPREDHRIHQKSTKSIRSLPEVHQSSSRGPPEDHRIHQTSTRGPLQSERSIRVHQSPPSPPEVHQTSARGPPEVPNSPRVHQESPKMTSDTKAT